MARNVTYEDSVFGDILTTIDTILEFLDEISPNPLDEPHAKDHTSKGNPQADVVVHPKTGDFTYQNSPPQLGDTPNELIGSIEIRTKSGDLLASITGLSVSYADLVALASPTAVSHFLYDGDNTITDNSKSSVVHALGGADLVFGDNGNDKVYGGTGNDTLNGDAGNDTLFGEGDLDGLFGGVGNDKEYGGAGNDLVHGGDGNDTLNGDAGNDTLTGGFGRDTLTAGAGLDRFLYQTLPIKNGLESGLTAATRDVITDFKHGQDKIDPSFILVPKFKFMGTAPLTGLGQIHYKYVGKDTLVEISTDSDKAAELSILLKGHITLSVGDFIL